jgi:hypothetical protein
MNRIHPIRRLAAVLACLAGGLLALAGAAPAALATNLPPPGGSGGTAGPTVSTVPVTIVAGGMPGWQITLIAIGAALLAATVAVFLDRARAMHRSVTTTAA